MLAKADGARDWLSAPIDMNFLYAYYTYSNSETSINSNLPVDGAEVSAHVPILRYARTFDMGGRVGGIQFVVPYAFIDAELAGTCGQLLGVLRGDHRTQALCSNSRPAPRFFR